MNLETAKILGIIGAVINIIGLFTGGYASIVGFILILLAVYGVSSATNRPDIFKNYIIAFVMFIIGLIVAIVGIIGTIMGSMGLVQGGPPETVPETNIVSILMSIIVWLIVLWIFLVIGTYFLRKSYKGIAEALNHGLFSTTGTLYFIGGILTIVIIGALILLIAIIVELVAWATMPTKKPSTGEQPPPPSGATGVEEPII